jgi:cell wall-associated NlpC family hydrolase
MKTPPLVSNPGASQGRVAKMSEVLRGRRIQLSQLSGPKDPGGVVYSLANNRIVRVEQIGFPSMVTGHRIQPAKHKPRYRPPQRQIAQTVYHTRPSSQPLTSRGSSLVTVSVNVGTSTNLGMAIAKSALHFVGTPYRWGGDSPAGFDCSGLSNYVYSMFHVDIPRTSYAQFEAGQFVSRADLLPGDLVFFQTDSAGASHVAIYVGNDLIVQALNEQTGVVVSRLSDSYYTSRYLGARRPW